MEENTPENQDQKNLDALNKIQQFEMGGVQKAEEVEHSQNNPELQINHYKDQQNTTTTANQNPVDPTNGVPPKSPNPGTVKPDKKKKKNTKALKLLLSLFVGFLVVFLVISIIFVVQAGNGNTTIASALGLDPAGLINALFGFINFIFIVLALIVFFLVVSNFFRSTMTKKDEMPLRKKYFTRAIFSAVALVFTIIIWTIVFLSLDGLRTTTNEPQIKPIVTTPEDTLLLTAPAEIRFDGSNIPFDRNKYSILSHQWAFGDGETATNQIVTHTYTELGTFDVVLTLNLLDKETGEKIVGGQFSHIVSVTDQALTATFDADPESGEAPLEVTFDASNSVDPDGTITSYEWDLTGNNIFTDAEGEEITHVFEKVGSYNVSLRVTTSVGEFDTHTKKITVTESEVPEAEIVILNDPKKYEAGVAYSFTAENATSPNGKIKSYLWDFGDGKLASTKSASHAFATPGTYNVSLTITDDLDKTTTVEKLIQISGVAGLPQARITTNPALPSGKSTLVGTVPFTVLFDARASTDPDDDIVEYTWTRPGMSEQFFSDVTTITFNEVGTQEVTLTVTDSDGNTDTESIQIQTEAQGILPKITATPIEGSAPLTVTFDASGSSYQGGEITSYRWNFGDGTPVQDGVASMTRRYDQIGTYTATVTVIASDGKTASETVNISVRAVPLTACFSSVFDSGVAPLETRFDPSCSTGTATSYFWDFGDGNTSSEVKPDHTFEDPGTYSVNLEISDRNNNISTFEKVITVE